MSVHFLGARHARLRVKHTNGGTPRCSRDDALMRTGPRISAGEPMAGRRKRRGRAISLRGVLPRGRKRACVVPSPAPWTARRDTRHSVFCPGPPVGRFASSRAPGSPGGVTGASPPRSERRGRDSREMRLAVASQGGLRSRSAKPSALRSRAPPKHPRTQSRPWHARSPQARPRSSRRAARHGHTRERAPQPRAPQPTSATPPPSRGARPASSRHPVVFACCAASGCPWHLAVLAAKAPLRLGPGQLAQIARGAHTLSRARPPPTGRRAAYRASRSPRAPSRKAMRRN